MELPDWTEYWKSNARKFCEFCKCWIADNKISVSLHEDGQRHKNNVAKKISIIHKQSAKDFKAQAKIDSQISRMEKLATAAYLNDIQNNADLTSQLINQKLAGQNRADIVRKEVRPDNSSFRYQSSASSSYYLQHAKKTSWQEAKSEGGHSYYWNTDTNEASWEVPDEGFVTLNELASKLPGDPNKKPKEIPKPPKKGKKNGKNPPKPLPQLPPPKPEIPVYIGEQPSNKNPYGKWTTVKSADVDLQLPKVPQAPVVAAPVVIIAPKPEKQFKEKQIESLEDDGSASGFKKRKINSNAKRNTRQRLDDD